MMKKINKHLIKFVPRIFLALVILGLVASAIFFAFSNSTIKNHISTATTVRPETFTELYFEEHLGLPTKASPEKEYSFKFTIHNLENKEMKYPYEVYLDIGSEKIFLDKNVVTLKDGESTTIEERFRAKNPIARTKIVVYLVEKKQHISFWIEVPNENTQ